MEKVKRLRKETGLKQKEMAEKMEMHYSNYANLENGRYVPANIKELESKAVKILKPHLLKKVLDIGDEYERLQMLMLQFNN